MNRRFVTADDVLRAAADGRGECVVRSSDRITPLARDVARDKGVRIVVRDDAPGGDPPGDAGTSADQSRASGVRRAVASVPRITHVVGAAGAPLDPFPVDLGRPDMDVRVRDLVTSRDGVPMAAGVMSLREGSFPWTLDYDEIEYVLEGELHVTTATQRVVARPGDIVAVPKGTAITFGTPSWARFLYVTYPADWSAT